MKYYVALPSGTGTGWTICSKYLRQELSKLTDFTFLTPEHPLWGKELDGVLFTSVADISFQPSCPSKAKKVIGYAFFENILREDSIKNARAYDHLYVGAKWCVDKLAENDIKAEVLYQGVDESLFYPKPHSGDIRKLFSGGKFELRKGQDIVMASYKELVKKDPELELHVLWDNPWPISIDTMRYSPYISFAWQWNKPFQDNLLNLFKINDIPTKNLNIILSTPYEKLNEVYWNTDLGLFPNRCEGGTNLVLMEYIACNRPVMMDSGHGHKDLMDAYIDAECLYNSLGFKSYSNISYDGVFDWSNMDPDQVTRNMPHSAYYLEGQKQRVLFTWEAMAKQVFNKMEELCK